MKLLIAKIIAISGLFIIPSIWAWQLTNTSKYIQIEGGTNGDVWIKGTGWTNWNTTYRIANFSTFQSSCFIIYFPTNYVYGTALSNLDEVRAEFYKQKPIISTNTNEMGYWTVTFEPVK